jgi:hypothetical protein
MITPGGEQLVLPLGGLLVQGADAADDEPGGDLLVLLLRGERRVGGLGDLGVADPAAGLLAEDRPRVADGGPGVLGDGGDRVLDAGIHRDGDRAAGQTR